MWKFSEIAAGIAGESLLHRAAFADVDLDGILDQRDAPEFEEPWLAAFEDVAAAWGQFPAADAMQTEVDRIRELAFKKCYEYTEHPDFCGYVSDDFELMAKASAMRLDSRFLSDLMNEYAGGSVPH